MDVCSRMVCSTNVISRIAITLFLAAWIGSASRADGWPGDLPACEPAKDRLARLELTHPQQALQQGQQLESRRQWADALSLYQQAIKQFPNDRSLHQRRSIARIHFDLDRRYSDSSFLQTVKNTDANQALSVYAEVLAKIQSYYVDEPDWPEIARSGLISLEIALQSDEFRQANISAPERVDFADAVTATRQALQKFTVKDRNDAYRFAGAAGNLIQRHTGVPLQSSIYEFICGAISALDPYSAFMSDSQYGETMSQIEGNFVGLGVELRTHPNELEIVSVIPGGPASNGGLAVGDRIVAVDNRDVEEVGSERAADLLRGLEGSFVVVEFARGTDTSKLRLQRRRVEIPSIEKVAILDPQYGIGYIGLTNFQKTTARDFDDALWKLHRAGMRSLIVDVRGNPGGLLSASVEIADRFLADGVIVSTRGRNPLEDYVHHAQKPSTWRVPLIVLIDENSASASEIFAAAVKDHHRGTIVGTQSYGKGSVQGIFPLNSSAGGVRLTTAKFYSPNGQPISQVGVKPHYVPQQVARAGDAARDDQSDGVLNLGIQVAKRDFQRLQKTDQPAVAGR